MLKIKIFAIAAFLILTTVVLSSSRHFKASANEDVLQEIAKYKLWSKITKEPVRVNDSNLEGG